MIIAEKNFIISVSLRKKNFQVLNIKNIWKHAVSLDEIEIFDIWCQNHRKKTRDKDYVNNAWLCEGPALRRFIFRHWYGYQWIRKRILNNLRGGFDLLTCSCNTFFLQKPKNWTFFKSILGQIVEVNIAFSYTSSHRSSTNFFFKRSVIKF